MSKRFYVLQAYPDALATDSHAGLLWVDTDRGCVIDHLVQRAACRSFDGGRVDAELEDRIERIVALWPIWSASMSLPLLRQIHDGQNFWLERQYRSDQHGVEFTLLSSREGLALPLTLPEVAPHDDFCVSLHHSVWDLITGPDLFPEAVWHTPQSLQDLFARVITIEGFRFSGSATSPLRIWFPKEQFIFYDREHGRLNMTFLARRESQPETTEYSCRLHLESGLFGPRVGDRSSAASGIPLDRKALSLIVDKGPGDEADRRAFEQQLRDSFAEVLHLRQMKLPNLPDLPPAARDHWQQLRDLPLVQIANGREYLTLRGQLCRQTSAARPVWLRTG